MDTQSETLQKALHAIQKLKKQLHETQKKVEPIAIVGLSCRFPQANNKQEFWDILVSGKNCITPFPTERWDLLQGSSESSLQNKAAYLGGYINNIDQFDTYFFGITPREAARMDPQQRLLLEVSYEAIEDAGIPMESLHSSNMGVFASLYASLLGQLQEIESEQDALYLPTGNAVSIAANRLSYFFDLQGPSFVIDTACSSSLVATHLACLNLQNNLCDRALVCGVSINLFPSINALLSRAKMLSPDGQCKTFDASANGYVQGEGVGAIVLKPLSKAIAQGDRIYAVIAGSAVNQDGKTNGLTAPNGLQQESVLKAAYKNANIDPKEVSYVECHGTGTVLGDPIELQALGEVLGKNRSSPCLVGSVKTNIGHLEPAAGIAGVIKMALSLYHNQIPAHLHFSTPNPYIDFDKYHLQVPTTTQAWPQTPLKIGGISGFGFGGTNAHVVMQEYKNQQSVLKDDENKIEIFTISAKDKVSLALYVESWIKYLETHPECHLWQLCYLTHVRRSHYSNRLAILASNVKELQGGLLSYVLKKPLKITPQNEVQELATSYMQGKTIDWHQYEKNRHCIYFDIPTHPWQHKKYWPPLRTASTDIKQLTTHPFQASVVNSPLDNLQCDFYFNMNSIPEIKDTQGILHIGFYLEMLAFAEEKLLHQGAFSIEDLEFLSPILVSERENTHVQLIIEKNNEFNFYSTTSQQAIWHNHARGKLKSSPAPTQFSESIESIKARCLDIFNQENFYNRIQEMGMPSTGSLRWINTYFLGKNEVLCEVKPPLLSTPMTHLKLNQHFSLMDACIQGVFQTLPGETKHPFVTTKIKALSFHANTQQPRYLYSQLTASHNQYSGSWFLLSENGEVVAECDTFTITKLANSSHLSTIINTASEFNFDILFDKVSLKNYLQTEVATLFSMPKKDVNTEISLLDMGMDSLMALMIAKLIEDKFKMTMPLQTILKGPTIADLTQFILEKNVTHQAHTSNPWLAYHTPSSTSKIKLFCFPYGGAGASVYRDWQQSMPESIEVCPIQLPGRENRLDEKPIGDLQMLLNILIHNLKNEFNKPFAFFGHSFGALISFELTRELRRRNMNLPERLFVSAYPDPRLQTVNLTNLLAELHQKNILDFNAGQTQENQIQFQTILQIFNNHGLADFSSDIMNAEIFKLLFPLFIADVGIVKNYFYAPEVPLDLPITVFLGHTDTWILPDDHLGWAEHTSQHCKFYEFNAGHLFIKEELVKQEILKQISEALMEPMNRKELLSTSIG